MPLLPTQTLTLDNCLWLQMDLKKKHLLKIIRHLLQMLFLQDQQMKTENIDWLSIDVGVTTAVGVSTHLYLRGFESEDIFLPVLTQGYRDWGKSK